MTNGFMTRGTDDRSGGEGRKWHDDPYDVYRRWFEVWGGARKGERGDRTGSDEIEELWRRWFAGTAKGWGGRSTEGGAAESLGPLWKQMSESLGKEAASGAEPPEDPVEFFLRWYGETSEKWTEVAGDLLKKKEVLESNARLQENFARSYRELRHASEESLKSLHMPSRSDVSRVAKLVVGVENKVDRLEEAFGEFVYGNSEPATEGSVRALQERMDALETKMDRILEALEKGNG